jgi:hypothetical protein
LIYWYIGSSVLLTYAVLVSYYCLKFAMVILRVQESIEESVDLIEEKYESMSEILSRPLFYDSPEVRRVVEDISEVRDSLNQVAFDLTNKLEKDTELE